MTLPLLGTSEVVPYAVDANPSHPAVCVLPDDTVLIAWQDFTSGTITVRHYSRDLAAVSDETSLPGATEGDIRLPGMALFLDGDAATLVVDKRVFAVTTGPLSVTQTGTYADLFFTRGASSTVTLPDGATATAAEDEVVIHRAGNLTRLPAPSVVTSLYPADGSAIYLSVNGPSDRSLVYRMDTTTGATSLVETGPIPPTLNLPGPGRPGVYPTKSDGIPLTTYNAAGGTIAASDWPADAATSQQIAYVGSTPHPAGGWVSAWWVRDWETGAAHIGLAHDTDTALTVQELPHANLAGLEPPVWSQSPVVASNGRTAVVVLTGSQNSAWTGAPADAQGITAWSVEVGQGGLLDVNTLDGWWTVGTRNPNMAYELLISTPLGWKVEIVAGEEHLATDELCVYAPHHEEAGEDGWVVCALFRPE